jgi:hypothetical protein
MEKLYKVLFVDDDKRYALPLIERAYSEYKFELQYCEDWEEGKSLLEYNPEEFCAIILDGKGKLSQDDKGDNPQHLAIAISDLKDFKVRGRFFPYVINTAYYEEFEKYFGNEVIVSKSDPDKLFFILKGFLISSDVEKVKNKYHEAFTSSIEKILGKTNICNLASLLVDVENNTFTKKSFNTIRDIFESVLKTGNQIDQCILPNECMKTDGKPNLEWSCRYLTNERLDILGRDNKVIKTFEKGTHGVSNEHACACIWVIKQLSSIFSHDYNETSYTINAYRTCLFALMEFIIWFTDYVLKNYPEKL